MQPATVKDVPTSILAEDFLDWLSSRNGDVARCPVCSYDHWNLLTDFEKCSLIGMHAFPITVGNSGWGKPFVQLECKRCAYVALFSGMTISEWVRNGKPQFKEAPENGQ